MRFFLIGLPGSGKSHWAKIWSERNSIPYYDLDDIIEKSEGFTISEIFKNEGEQHFRNLETFYLEKLIKNFKVIIIACGGGTPCFNDNMDLMNQSGKTIYLNEPISQIADRLWQSDKQSTRPLLADCNNIAEVTEKLKEMNAQRSQFYKQAKVEWESWDEASLKF